jgi:uncharacterized protein YdeI (BOF family)
MIRKSLFAIAIGSLLALPVAAEGTRVKEQRPLAHATAERPLTQQRITTAHREDTYVTLTGRVTEARPESFLLDHGSGHVLVDMRDWGWYQRDFRNLEGSRVTVQGRLDEAWPERSVINADALYAADRRQVYYAPTTGTVFPAGRQQALVTYAEAPMQIIGTVAAIDPQAREIRVDSGGINFAVTTDRLAQDPIRGEPFELHVGNRIIAAGRLISPAGERGRKLEAQSLILLTEDERRVDANLARLQEDRY